MDESAKRFGGAAWTVIWAMIAPKRAAQQKAVNVNFQLGNDGSSGSN